MKHTNYFAEFANVYSKAYNDIVKMMQEEGITRLELERDEVTLTRLEYEKTPFVKQ